MEATIMIVAGYAAGGLIFAIVFGASMFLRFDRVERSGIWGYVWVWSAAWPFSLGVILRHGFPKFFDDEARISKERAVAEALRANPPPCGETVVFRYAEADRVLASFRFPAHLVAVEAREMDAKSVRDSDFDAIARWAAQGNAPSDEPSPLPVQWSERFRYVANALLRRGEGHCYCEACKKRYPASILTIECDQGKPGWNFNRFACPLGHEVFVVPTMHLNVVQARRGSTA